MTKAKTIKVLTYLSKRLAEPSSHAALAAFFINIGFATNGDAVQGACFLLSAGFSLAGLIMKDDKTKG